MPTRHINRRKKEVSAEDEWAHITGVGEKIDTIDAMEVQDRSITFKNEYNVPETAQEAYEQEKRQAKDDIGNTAQYLKFVNESIKLKKERVDQFQKKQQQFQDEIDALQHQPKSEEQLNRIKYKDIGSNDIVQTIELLEKEREEIKKKVDYHARQVSNAQQDMLEKEKQIVDIKAELEITMKREANQQQRLEKEDPIAAIKNKVQKMGSSDDIKSVLAAIEELSAKLDSR